MAIGTAAAIGLGLAGVGAGASALSSNSASRRAAETSQQNNAANTALAREIYGSNQQALSPFMTRGNAAGNQINALLGLGGSQQAAQPAAVQPNALSQFYGSTGTAGLPYGLGDGYYAPGDFNPSDVGAYPGYNPNALSAYGTPQGYVGGQPVANTTAGGATGQTAQEAANDAFDIFRNSTGYQFRLGEGLDAVNSGYAGAGTLQSGAAMRGITEYGQNFASNEFANYLNALGAQQSVGAGAASSLAGVGQNFASQVINSNNQNAANQMNAQLARQSGFGNLAGIIGGGLFQYGLPRAGA